MAGYARAWLGPRTWAQSPPNPWNFLLGDATKKYTAVGALTPFLPVLGTTPALPTATVDYLITVGSKVFNVNGYYDFTTHASGSYSGCSTVYFIINVAGTYYGICDTNKLGTSADCITWTTVTLPTISGHTPSGGVIQLFYDGSFLQFLAPYSSNNYYWLTTADGGATWNSKHLVLGSGNVPIACWINGGNQYVFCQFSVGSTYKIVSSANYFSTSATSATYTHTTAIVGDPYKSIVLNSNQIFIYYRTDVRVFDWSNTVADLTYTGTILYPIIDSDLTMYGYNAGIYSSTDFVTFTQLSTESSPTGAQFLWKKSQLVG